MNSRPDGWGRRRAVGVRQRVFVVLAAALAMFALSMGGAPSASAHASLLFTTPGAGTSVSSSPRTLTLIFDQPVTLTGNTVRIAAQNGASAAVGSAARDKAGRVVTVAVRQAMAPGVYTVTWQVVADDGDVVTGNYQFGVGPRASSRLSTGSLGASATSGQAATTVLRWVLFAALALAVGGAAALRLVGRYRPDEMAVPRSWMLPASLAGTLASLGLVGLIVGEGSLLAAFVDPAAGELTSRPAVLTLVEAGAFAVAAVLGRVRPRSSWMPLVAVVVAEGWRAHPESFLPGWGALATMLHLVAAGLWAGALVYVLRCVRAWRSAPGAAWAALTTYAWMAAWLFGAVVLSGVLSALIVVPLDAWVTTDYGRLVLLKAALVVAVAGCALAARARLGGRRERGLPVRLVRAETWLLVGVLAVTASLTAAAPPGQTAAALSAAPPPSGLVVPIGARIGQIGLSVQASAGQVVVWLTAPGADMPGADAGYRLAATLATPSGKLRPLRLRDCGVGCFVAPVAWESGTNQVTLRADSRAWDGGTVSLAVPWPARDGAKALERTVQILRRSEFTLYERVTSDTARSGSPYSTHITGKYLLASEPYSGGRAAYADLVPGPGGTATLLIGYPSEKVQVEFALDAEGRIVRETETSPNHLVVRAFVYPEKE
ncbi:copper resistance CopC/CopD family protein [Streptomyces sp. CA-106131]|uniref:copper resistance CopC/CopD family protein n=2 Tax=unclassified Streptomyces TaxID=2593676 RepID=UPI003D8A1F58